MRLRRVTTLWIMKSAEPCEVWAHQFTWQHKYLHCFLCKKYRQHNSIKWKGTKNIHFLGGPIPFDDMARPWRTPRKNTATLWQYTSLSKWSCCANLCQFLLKLTEAWILLCLSIGFNTPITGICELSRVNADAGMPDMQFNSGLSLTAVFLGCTESLPLQVTRVFPCRNRLYF